MDVIGCSELLESAARHAVKSNSNEAWLEFWRAARQWHETLNKQQERLSRAVHSKSAPR